IPMGTVNVDFLFHTPVESLVNKEDDNKKKTDEELVHLRREIGLLPAVSFIMGTVVGSGIFIAPKGVLMNSGSVGLSLLVWGLCGVLSLFEALCYFLFIRPAATSLVSLAFGRYVVEPFFVPCAALTMLIKLVSILGVTFLVAVNCLSVRMASHIQVSLTFIKIHRVPNSLSCRMLLVGAREGYWPQIFSTIHICRHTPLPALLLMYPLMVIMLINGDISQLISLTSFSHWFFIALATLGMLIHRYRFPLHPRPFKVIIFTAVSFFIVGLSLYSDPWNTGCSCILTLSGVPVYYMTVYHFCLPPTWRQIFSKSHTCKLQILLEVAQQEVKTCRYPAFYLYTSWIAS
uniref:Si:ch73-352p4.8 n=1 Tax=Neolamprologus brichardi TaxID=32507 RepID=A0A3Q4HK65_NEOBR